MAARIFSAWMASILGLVIWLTTPSSRDTIRQIASRMPVMRPTYRGSTENAGLEGLGETDAFSLLIS